MHTRPEATSYVYSCCALRIISLLLFIPADAPCPTGRDESYSRKNKVMLLKRAISSSVL